MCRRVHWELTAVYTLCVCSCHTVDHRADQAPGHLPAHGFLCAPGNPFQSQNLLSCTFVPGSLTLPFRGHTGFPPSVYSFVHCKREHLMFMLLMKNITISWKASLSVSGSSLEHIYLWATLFWYIEDMVGRIRSPRVYILVRHWWWCSPIQSESNGTNYLCVVSDKQEGNFLLFHFPPLSEENFLEQLAVEAVFLSS